MNELNVLCIDENLFFPLQRAGAFAMMSMPDETKGNALS